MEGKDHRLSEVKGHSGLRVSAERRFWYTCGYQSQQPTGFDQKFPETWASKFLRVEKDYCSKFCHPYWDLRNGTIKLGRYILKGETWV